MATTVCSLVNGGKRITPHFGVAVYDAESGEKEETISYGKRKRILSKETSEKMRKILETVVSEGGGKKAQIEGYRIGGKTATKMCIRDRTDNLSSAIIVMGISCCILFVVHKKQKIPITMIAELRLSVST